MPESKNPFTKAAEEGTTPVPEPEEEEPVEEEPEAESKPVNHRRRPAPKLSGVAALIDSDLYSLDTNAPEPVSAVTENLQAVVVGHNGIAVVKVSLKGWIGEEPVALPARDFGEFAELFDLLEAGAKEKIKARA